MKMINLFLMLFSVTAFAQTTTPQWVDYKVQYGWSPSDSSGVTGYYMYHKVDITSWEGGVTNTYTMNLPKADVGNCTNATFAFPLDVSKTNWFAKVTTAASAYTQGKALESNLSESVNTTAFPCIMINPTRPPTGGLPSNLSFKLFSTTGTTSSGFKNLYTGTNSWLRSLIRPSIPATPTPINVIAPTGTICPIQYDGKVFIKVSFDAQTGVKYTVEGTTNIASDQAEWFVICEGLTGATGDTLACLVDPQNSPNGFFRIKAEPAN